MNIKLTPTQARVLGCLIEKELTTPDYYPLSLHALTMACNQKSNRDPVMELAEAEVQNAVDMLIRQGLAAQRADLGGRVPKYAHKLAGTLTKTFEFSRAELAVMGELLLRGAQTPGELRARAARMHPFADLAEVEAILTRLATREEGPVAVELARQPGRREARHACLFMEVPEEASVAQERVPSADMALRVQALEEQVARLTVEVERLRGQREA